MSEAFDRQVRFTKRNFHPTAEGPCHCQVWIECQRSVYQGVAVFGFIDNIGEGEPGCAERDRIILPQLQPPAVPAAPSSAIS